MDEEMNEEMNEEMKMCEEPMKEPERPTSLREAEQKGEEVLKVASCLTTRFREMLCNLSPRTAEPPKPGEGERKAPGDKIEGLKFIFEEIECKLSELRLIQNQLVNIIGG